ncbi:hypothetical protein CNECB9_4920032 [Cupriavidus necator]|uniref:Uncharacterized protein n=2 Tax=Cupriavidus necator TaxID=106590 RepID=A0A1K0IZS5_CUPNE|nr:hypothetical protein CNECB9_4920032 [Cupriavidus necator]
MAMFDFLVGLQLNWIGLCLKIEVSEHLNPKRVQFGTRLKKLRPLLQQYFESAGATAQDEFSQWCHRAEEARAMRNDYVHGRWGVPAKRQFNSEGYAVEGHWLLGFVPLHWDLSGQSDIQEKLMTMEEFAADVDACERLLQEYRALSDRYERFVVLRPR